MRQIDIRFDFDESLNNIDKILEVDENVYKGSYHSVNTDSGRGSLVTASVVVFKFTMDTSPSALSLNKAKAMDILMSQIYLVVAGQPLLQHFEWDGEMLRSVFTTYKKYHIDNVLDSVAKIISMTDVINHKIWKRLGVRYYVKAAIDYGNLFAIPVMGDEPLWGGRKLKDTSELLGTASERRVIISKFVYNNMKEDYQKLFEPIDSFDPSSPFHADIINIGINNWLKEQRG